MLKKASIKIKRGNLKENVNVQNFVLQYGQPFYDTSSGQFYVGNNEKIDEDYNQTENDVNVLSKIRPILEDVNGDITIGKIGNLDEKGEETQKNIQIGNKDQKDYKLNIGNNNLYNGDSNTLRIQNIVKAKDGSETEDKDIIKYEQDGIKLKNIEEANMKKISSLTSLNNINISGKDIGGGTKDNSVGTLNVKTINLIVS